MVFAETSLTDNIQDSIDVVALERAEGHPVGVFNNLNRDIPNELKRYGYKKITHLPFDTANKIQEKIMSALQNGSEIIYYELIIDEDSSDLVTLTSGVSRDNLGIDYLCEIQRWDDEGDADDLETSLFFADDLLENMGLDYKMKQVTANGIMNLVKEWDFNSTYKSIHNTMEWWVKEQFSLFQPFNTLWPEWFVKEIESNTKV
jgi:hypothetical protein|tara:strand:- start:652 stop:1260 length:609 start_codon:yes stop_codon:yes gene_type:complete